jgi:hypothetical protein
VPRHMLIHTQNTLNQHSSKSRGPPGSKCEMWGPYPPHSNLLINGLMHAVDDYDACLALHGTWGPRYSHSSGQCGSRGNIIDHCEKRGRDVIFITFGKQFIRRTSCHRRTSSRGLCVWYLCPPRGQGNPVLVYPCGSLRPVFSRKNKHIVLHTLVPRWYWGGLGAAPPCK